jgi:hypothetical protein
MIGRTLWHVILSLVVSCVLLSGMRVLTQVWMLWRLLSWSWPHMLALRCNRMLTHVLTHVL